MTVYVYITSPHAEVLQIINDDREDKGTRANIIRVRKKTKAFQIARCLITCKVISDDREDKDNNKDDKDKDDRDKG